MEKGPFTEPLPTPRPPDAVESRLLDLAVGRQPEPVLQAQLDAAHVVARCTCGCPSVILATDAEALLPRERGLLAEATLDSTEELPEVWALLYAKGHKIAELEVISADGSHVSRDALVRHLGA